MSLSALQSLFVVNDPNVITYCLTFRQGSSTEADMFLCGYDNVTASDEQKQP